jgi:hypothetical protein
MEISGLQPYCRDGFRVLHILLCSIVLTVGEGNVGLVLFYKLAWKGDHRSGFISKYPQKFKWRDYL